MNALFHAMFAKIDSDAAMLTIVVSDHHFDKAAKINSHVELFTTSFDLLTGEHTVKRAAALTSDALYEELCARYTADYTRSEALISLQGYLRGESSVLPEHDVFGQETFHAHIDEGAAA